MLTVDREAIDVGLGGSNGSAAGRRSLLAVVVVLLGAAGLWGAPQSGATVDGGRECANESLRSALNLVLPDCRAYEMVSPPYQEGYPLLVAGVAGDGNSAIVVGFGTFAGNLGSTEEPRASSLYLDMRTADGWQLAPLNAPVSEFVGQYTRVVWAEPDRGGTLWIQHPPGQGASMRGLYARSAAGTFSFIGPDAPPSGREEEPSTVTELFSGTFDEVKATTDDYGHVVLEAHSPAVQWPFDETAGGGHSLYEYSGVGNEEPTLVGVEGARGSRHLIAPCGTTLGAGILGSSYNALSSDGETIFFTVNPCSPGPSTAEVYARLHGGVTGVGSAETVDVSASECTTVCGGESGKNFDGASEDGKLVYFTSSQKLTDEAVDGTAGGDASARRGCTGVAVPELPAVGGCNLYLYDFTRPVGARLRTVSVGGDVLGVVGIAENGARVYYASRVTIGSAGENVYGAHPTEGQPNLYVYNAESGRTAFIATLQDGSLWSKRFERPAQVAGRGGRFLLFASSTQGVTPDGSSPATQLFEYQAPGEGEDGARREAAELVRITKGEDGFNENGNGVAAGVAGSSIAEANERLGAGEDFKTTANPLNISVDGRRVFFITAGQLSQRATSAAQGCRSLYEFETAGALSEGAVSLISDGTDVVRNHAICGAGFQGIDALGGNVLFSTGDPLLASDVDGGQRDIYDARVDGGFRPSPNETVCGLGSCEGTASAPAVLPTVGSVSTGGEAPLPAGSKDRGRRKGASSGLARALRACRGKPRARRKACERAARRRFASRARVSKPGRRAR